jgi:hypothetical protein
MERESIPHDGNSQQSFAALPLKPNGQRKTWVRTTESQPIQQSPGMNRPVEFAGGAFRNTTRQPDRWADPHLGANWNPRTTTFIQAELVAPTPPAGTLLDLPLQTSPARPVEEEDGRIRGDLPPEPAEPRSEEEPPSPVNAPPWKTSATTLVPHASPR